VTTPAAVTSTTRLLPASRDKHVARAIHGHTRGVFRLRVPEIQDAGHADRRHFDHAVVAGVRNKEITRAIQRQARGSRQGQAAGIEDTGHALGHLHHAAVARIHNIDIARAIHGQARGMAEA